MSTEELVDAAKLQLEIMQSRRNTSEAECKAKATELENKAKDIAEAVHKVQEQSSRQLEKVRAELRQERSTYLDDIEKVQHAFYSIYAVLLIYHHMYRKLLKRKEYSVNAVA